MNRYGASMLEELRLYPDELGVLVRGAFSDVVALDNAIAWYVRDAPSDIDRAAIQENRQLLGLSEDNHLHFFAGKVHIRTYSDHADREHRQKDDDHGVYAGVDNNGNARH